MTNQLILLRQLRKSDRIAFRRIFDLYAPQVYQFAFALLKTPERAETIVREVFTGLWEKRATTDDDLSLNGYLFSLASQSLIKTLREMYSPCQLQDILQRLTTQSGTSLEEQALYRELEWLYQQAVAQLPPLRREIYLLSHRDGLTTGQIAERLQVAIPDVEDDLYRAFEFLNIYFHQHAY